MGINNNVQSLIKSVADNDIQKAKAYIKVILANDTSESNKWFRNQITAKLSSPQSNMFELPQSVKGLVQMEDVSISFREGRYFLTEREKSLYGKIVSARKTCEKLSELGIRYINATMLSGESGTGKTTFGRYVAYKMGVPFAYMNFANLIGSYLGETGKNIQKVFDYIKSTPCVLMLDEIDAIGLTRGHSSEVGEMSRVVIGLMQALDMLENGVTVIAATNRMDILDAALVRRFTFKHEVLPLEQNEVSVFAEQFLDDVGVEYNKLELGAYAHKAPNKQSELTNDLIEKIIAGLETGEGVSLI